MKQFVFSPYGAAEICAITPNDHVKSGGMICPVSPWALPENSEYGRKPFGLRKGQPADFHSQFDRLTIFYDCFRASDTQVMLVGPPLKYFSGILDSLQVSSTPSESNARTKFATDPRLTSATGMSTTSARYGLKARPAIPVCTCRPQPGRRVWRYSPLDGPVPGEKGTVHAKQK